MSTKDKNNKIWNVICVITAVILITAISFFLKKFRGDNFYTSFMLFSFLYIIMSLFAEIIEVMVKNSKADKKKEPLKKNEEESERKDTEYVLKEKSFEFDSAYNSYKKETEKKEISHEYVSESENKSIDENPFSSNRQTEKKIEERHIEETDFRKKDDSDDKKKEQPKIIIPDVHFTFKSTVSEEDKNTQETEKDDAAENVTANEDDEEEIPEIVLPDAAPEEWKEQEAEEKTEQEPEKEEYYHIAEVLSERERIESYVSDEVKLPETLNSIKDIEEIENDAKNISESINSKLSERSEIKPLVFASKKKDEETVKNEPDNKKDGDIFVISAEKISFEDRDKEEQDNHHFDERPDYRPRLYDSEVEESTKICINPYARENTEAAKEKEKKITRNKEITSEKQPDRVSADREKLNLLFGNQSAKNDQRTGIFSGRRKNSEDEDYEIKTVPVVNTQKEPEKPDYSRRDTNFRPFGSQTVSYKSQTAEKQEIKKETRQENKPLSSNQVKTAVSKYKVPSLDILADHRDANKNPDKEEEMIRNNEEKLLSSLASFGINAKITNAQRGPSVTRYELQPEPGVKVSRILSLSDDIALSLASAGIRFEAPIPGKSAIGIEVPNKETDIVYLKDILKSSDYLDAPSKLSVGLGRDISGNVVVGDIGKFPHVLIAGSTGSGKSVCINTIITSILFKAAPSDVKMIMIDPKVVELGIYNGLPHLLVPVVTNPKKAAAALNWAVNEVENRYAKFAEKRVRDLKGYNQTNSEEKMPHIVIIIDELADLMMTSSKEVEDCIIRLAQKARAAGVHLVIATQRPSVDVITGLIKANIPSRIAFAVASYVDSRTILDTAGAEKLLGRGDMLYYPIGMIKPKRVQGAFVSDDEVETLVEEIKSKCGEAEYNQEVINALEHTNAEKQTGSVSKGEEEENADLEMIIQAGDLAVEFGQMSTSFLQRKLKIGFSRAARVIDVLEEKGIVSAAEGSKPRSTLVNKEEWETIKETI